MDSFENVLPKMLQLPIFSDFSDKDENDIRLLKMLYENMQEKKFRKGEVIIKEGDVGENFYILYSGTVHIYRTTPAGDSIALANLSSDQKVFFGENALIDGDPRSATVQATSECSTIALSGKKFLNLCKQEPVLGFRIILYIAQNMAKTIRKTNTDKATLYEALFNEIEGNYD